jgi:hypothetical protein
MFYLCITGLNVYFLKMRKFTFLDMKIIFKFSMSILRLAFKKLKHEKIK